MHLERVLRGARAAGLAALACVVFAAVSAAQAFPAPGSTGSPGLDLRSQGASGLTVHYEMGSFSFEPVTVDGTVLQKVALRGVFLPNDAGAPDLPGMSRFVAVPRGATATVRIVSSRTRIIPGVDLAPAPVLPKENEDGPLVCRKDAALWSRNASYPENPVRLSDPAKMRGVDVVMLGVTPFQYNPVTKDLTVYEELDLAIEFHGGTGTFGEERLRSRNWEPILAEHLMNYASLPAVDFDRPRERNGWEYIIITPDDPVFIAWADTLKNWRKLQGISTEVFTTTQTGSTAAQIEAFLNNAYQTWNPAPDAFLLLGDYPAGGPGITSPIWNSYCVSDNIFADVDADNLPDMIHARLTARNASELSIMIGKMMSYERTPVMDPAYYDHPIIAGGWQTERWFILCSEVVLGFLQNGIGQHPIREEAIYSGTPGSVWSTAQNTSTVVNYFGPNGLGYIPATPQYLTDWGGNATRINNDINAGSWLLLHRDHGAENGWGEPAYTNSNLSGLHNEYLPFVMSMNCLTGKYNWSSECFTEAFHRMGQGALGLTAASEISYSFVNDVLIWGMIDQMWPQFMPDYGPFPPPTAQSPALRPAFGMCSGKYFLQSSSWPYNTGDKLVTYHLFHHHGDAFLTLNSQVPQAMMVNHPEVCLLGMSTFRMSAEAGSFIALTVNGEIIGTAQATGLPQDVAITPQTLPGTLRITVTAPNRIRFDQGVPIVPADGPFLVYNDSSVLDGQGDDDGVLDAAETPDLALSLKNVGNAPATNVTATLSTADPYVQVQVAQQVFPDIPPGGIGTSLAPYRFTVSGTVPDGHTVPFTVDAGNGWVTGFSLPVQAPVVGSEQVYVDDSAGGNADGVPDPGETVRVSVRIGNTGHAGTGDLTGTLSSSSMFVIVSDAEGTSPNILPGDSGLLGTFEMQILTGCPNPGPLGIHFDVAGAGGYAADFDATLDIGAWLDTAENDRGWTLGAAGDNAVSGTWVRADPVGTTYNGQQCQPEDDHTASPGVVCFVTGNGSPGGTAGEQDVDGGKTTLLTPVFHLGNASSASVSYWRWYTNNLGNNPNQDYWDVDVTADGTNWTHLEHTTNSANSWSEFTFNLPDYITLTDNVQLRFVADDVSPNSLLEAAVDDFTLDASFAGTTAVPDGPAPKNLGIVSLGRNPSDGRGAIAFRTGTRGLAVLELFDVAGRRVRLLANGVVEPGTHSVPLQGEHGARLASGVYFLRLRTPEVMQIRTVTILK